MKGTLNAIIEKAEEGGYWATCPEIAGANGQGDTIDEAKNSLKQSILLIFEDRLEDLKKNSSSTVILDSISIE